MKYTITNLQTQQKFEFTKERFIEKLASFLTLYETTKPHEDKNRILATVEKTNALFIYHSNGFKFVVLPERKTL